MWCKQSTRCRCRTGDSSAREARMQVKAIAANVFQQTERSNKRCACVCNLNRMHCFPLPCKDGWNHSLKSMIEVAVHVGVLVSFWLEKGREVVVVVLCRTCLTRMWRARNRRCLAVLCISGRPRLAGFVLSLQARTCGSFRGRRGDWWFC